MAVRGNTVSGPESCFLIPTPKHNRLGLQVVQWQWFKKFHVDHSLDILA